MKSWKTIVMFLPVAGLVLLAGCQTGRCDAGKSPLAPEIASADQVKILWADACQTSDRLVLRGAIRRRHADLHTLRAHVDVEVETADGIRQARTPVVWIPRRRPGKGPDFTWFEIELPPAASDLTAIRLKPHEGQHPDEPAI